MGFISKSLPHLFPESADNLKEKLKSIGVYDISDMSHVQKNDLADVLKPIQIRKLIQKCCSGLFMFFILNILGKKEQCTWHSFKGPKNSSISKSLYSFQTATGVQNGS